MDEKKGEIRTIQAKITAVEFLGSGTVRLNLLADQADAEVARAALGLEVELRARANLLRCANGVMDLETGRFVSEGQRQGVCAESVFKDFYQVLQSSHTAGLTSVQRDLAHKLIVFGRAIQSFPGLKSRGVARRLSWLETCRYGSSAEEASHV